MVQTTVTPLVQRQSEAANPSTSTLKLFPDSPKMAALVIVLSIIGCTAWIIGVDWTYSRVLTPAYIAWFGEANAQRTAIIVIKACLDEGERVALLGVILLGAAVVLPGRKLGLGLLFWVLVVGQLFVSAFTHQALSPYLDYNLLRYFVPSALWVWLLLRYGFATALLGHTLTHPLLDPSLAALIQHHL